MKIKLIILSGIVFLFSSCRNAAFPEKENQILDNTKQSLQKTIDFENANDISPTHIDFKKDHSKITDSNNKAVQSKNQTSSSTSSHKKLDTGNNLNNIDSTIRKSDNHSNLNSNNKIVPASGLTKNASSSINKKISTP